MKKIITLTLSLCCIINAALAQTGQKKNASENFAKKGDNFINVYYGVSIFNRIYKSVISTTAENVRNSILGPMGIVYEHIVADGIGLGCELGYTQLKTTYTENHTDFSSSQGAVSKTYTTNFTITTIRVMFRANFHFIEDEKLDAYILISAGYRDTNYKFASTNPSSRTETLKGFIPFGIKPGIGIRYLFTDNIGAHVELALGTPLIGGGLTFKL